jgi:hypothetical protein
MKAAPVAYDVVSFWPTQTSRTRLVVIGEIEKPAKDFSRAGLAGIEKAGLAVLAYSASLIHLTRAICRG